MTKLNTFTAMMAIVATLTIVAFLTLTGLAIWLDGQQLYTGTIIFVDGQEVGTVDCNATWREGSTYTHDSTTIDIDGNRADETHTVISIADICK